MWKALNLPWSLFVRRSGVERMAKSVGSKKRKARETKRGSALTTNEMDALGHQLGWHRRFSVPYGIPNRRSLFVSEEGNQATCEAGHLVSPERTRDKNESREATSSAKQTVFTSERGRKPSDLRSICNVNQISCRYI